jgi:hypothetical protein
LTVDGIAGPKALPRISGFAEMITDAVIKKADVAPARRTSGIVTTGLNNSW